MYTLPSSSVFNWNANAKIHISHTTFTDKIPQQIPYKSGGAQLVYYEGLHSVSSEAGGQGREVSDETPRRSPGQSIWWPARKTKLLKIGVPERRHLELNSLCYLTVLTPIWCTYVLITWSAFMADQFIKNFMDDKEGCNHDHHEPHAFLWPVYCAPLLEMYSAKYRISQL